MSVLTQFFVLYLHNVVVLDDVTSRELSAPLTLTFVIPSSSPDTPGATAAEALTHDDPAAGTSVP